MRLRARHSQLIRPPTDVGAVNPADEAPVPAAKPRRPTRTVHFAALLLVVSLCGCGRAAPEDRAGDGHGQPPPSAEVPPRPGPLDACAILTRQQVGDVLGEPPADPIVGMNEPGDDRLAAVSQCDWPARDSERLLAILIRSAPSDQNTPAAIEQVRETLRSAGLTLRDADGPGDVSFWTGAELHVFRGLREYVIVGLEGFDDADAARAAAQRAASFILERL